MLGRPSEFFEGTLIYQFPASFFDMTAVSCRFDGRQSEFILFKQNGLVQVFVFATRLTVEIQKYIIRLEKYQNILLLVPKSVLLRESSLYNAHIECMCE